MRADRDFDEDWLNKHLPDGYWAFRHWGRFDLLKTLPDGSSVTVRTGVPTRWQALRLAMCADRGQWLPYRFSAGYWQDIKHERSMWRARLGYLLWRLRWLV